MAKFESKAKSFVVFADPTLYSRNRARGTGWQEKSSGLQTASSLGEGDVSEEGAESWGKPNSSPLSPSDGSFHICSSQAVLMQPEHLGAHIAFGL